MHSVSVKTFLIKHFKILIKNFRTAILQNIPDINEPKVLIKSFRLQDERIYVAYRRLEDSGICYVTTAYEIMYKKKEIKNM